MVVSHHITLRSLLDSNPLAFATVTEINDSAELSLAACWKNIDY